jgi:hypothetical protein
MALSISAAELAQEFGTRLKTLSNTHTNLDDQGRSKRIQGIENRGRG